MTQIVSDISKQVEWVARKASPAQLTVNCLQNGSPFNISTYTFTAELWRVGGTAALVTLTEGSGITNGGAAGTIGILYNETQLNITPDSYRWYLKAVHPDTKPYQWFNGPFKLNGELYEGSSSQTVELEINIGGTSLDLEITIAGSAATLIDFDASGGEFPTGATRGAEYQVTVAGTIAGEPVPVGAILKARQDDPDDDWGITGWKLI